MYRVGDIIKVKRCREKTIIRGYMTPGIEIEQYITEEEIIEVFDSLDKTYKCFWIKGSDELITEHNLVQKGE